jgi:hypothetical protein
LTKGNIPTLVRATTVNRDNSPGGGLNTSRTADDIEPDDALYDQFKIKRFDDKFFEEQIINLFYKNYPLEIVKYNKHYGIGLFIQTSTYSENTMRFNDIYSVY